MFTTSVFSTRIISHNTASANHLGCAHVTDVTMHVVWMIVSFVHLFEPILGHTVRAKMENTGFANATLRPVNPSFTEYMHHPIQVQGFFIVARCWCMFQLVAFARSGEHLYICICFK